MTFLDIEQSKQESIKTEILKIAPYSNETAYLPKADEIDTGLKGKIVEKVVFEKHKHVFPYKNWKVVRKLLFETLFIV